jgi:hypothetical protein
MEEVFEKYERGVLDYCGGDFMQFQRDIGSAMITEMIRLTGDDAEIKRYVQRLWRTKPRIL